MFHLLPINYKWLEFFTRDVVTSPNVLTFKSKLDNFCIINIFSYMIFWDWFYKTLSFFDQLHMIIIIIACWNVLNYCSVSLSCHCICYYWIAWLEKGQCYWAEDQQVISEVWQVWDGVYCEGIQKIWLLNCTWRYSCVMLYSRSM